MHAGYSMGIDCIVENVRNVNHVLFTIILLLSFTYTEVILT